MVTDPELIEQASHILLQSHGAIALTGAGISTPSGIPDFRSGETGLWKQSNPMEVASILGFRYNPQAFYSWIRPLAQLMLDAKPNPAHHALTRLEELGILKGVITQNIDMLHTRAGATTVYEVHGHVRTMTCMTCFETVVAQPYLSAFLASEEVVIPHCPSCGGVLKPDVILFGEQLPMQVLLKAEQAIRNADVMIVAGSSLEVYPVADFPKRIKSQGGKVIIVNHEPTYIDDEADTVIHGDVADILPTIVEQVIRLQHQA